MDPKSRRDQLFRIHSALRSADNLRPDEAFDELVKLYRLWVEMGAVEVDRALARRFGVELSPIALQAASGSLWRLLDGAGEGIGGELFQELADVAVRSGLGQYFTPTPVAQAMADFLDPQPGEHWLDPFLGSGLLLGAVALAADGPLHLYGCDLDKRVIRVAALEAEISHPYSPLRAAQLSALEPPATVLASVDAPEGGVCGIVTNPPFGAVDMNGDGASDFELAQDRLTPIEVLAVEQCLRLLAPGGRMGIVLPQSVLSNKRLQYVREYLRTHGQIDAILSLPGEAFSMFEGVGKASVVFVTNTTGAKRSVWFGRSTSVGWDTTGRLSDDEDVRAVAKALRDRTTLLGSAEGRPLHADMDRNITAEWQIRAVGDGSPLGELAERIYLGKTPARALYGSKQEEGALRVLKVGNLTGSGVDWTDGERSYARFKKMPTDRLLQIGDIVLTAAAHHPRYIGAKVDLIDSFPPGWDGRCVPSGELLAIRLPDNEALRMALLLWLRCPDGRAAIQACVTGQTAHLHPEYVAEVRLPRPVVSTDLSVAADLLVRSLESRRISEELQAEANEHFTRLVNRDINEAESRETEVLKSLQPA
jgi:type I restriction enzyme M protein